MTVLLKIGALSILLGSMVLPSAAQTPGAKLPDGPGKATMQKICSGCHAPEIVIGRHETKDGWVRIVSDMADKGANGTDDEFNQIIDYLAAHFPQASNNSSQNQSD